MHGPGASAVALRGSALRAEHLRVTGNSEAFPRRAPRPSFAYGTNCSPDEAKRNPGTAFQLECCSPDYAALHPGYDDQRKKEAERRQTCSANLRALRARRAPLSLSPLPRAGEGREGARSPIGVPPRLLPSGLSALGRNSRPGFLGRGRTFDPVRSLQPGSKDSRSYAGVTRARLSQSRERTSRTGRSAGQMMPEAARRSVSFRARAPHSLRLQEYPRRRRPSAERDSGLRQWKKRKIHTSSRQLRVQNACAPSTER